MRGLVPRIHVSLFCATKTWMAGTRLHKAGHDGVESGRLANGAYGVA